MAIKLKTGLIAFPLEFDNGKKETIKFNPNDPELAVRLYNLRDKLMERAEKIDKDIPLNADGSARNSNDIEKLDKFISGMYEEIDTVFRSKISDKVFKYCSPLAIVDGERFVINFIYALLPEIEKNIKKAQKAEDDIIAKEYLSKYKK